MLLEKLRLLECSLHGDRRNDRAWLERLLHPEFREITRSPSPSNEDLLVLYIPEKDSWRTTCKNMDDAGFARVKSFNPYWDRDGVTFKDMDGYRVVIQNMHWGKL